MKDSPNLNDHIFLCYTSLITYDTQYDAQLHMINGPPHTGKNLASFYVTFLDVSYMIQHPHSNSKCIEIIKFSNPTLR